MNVYFVKDSGTLELNIAGKTLCLCHRKYDPPRMNDAKVLPFAVFRERYKNENMLSDVDNVVFVGTNHIITPSNRTDPVFELLFTGIRMNKISVDNVPFISVPWRTWFHFGITNKPYNVYDYSYKAETDYNKYVDGYSDFDPFSLEEMLKYSHGVACSNYDVYFDYEIVEAPVFPDVVSAYKDLKDELFETERSPKTIINKLARFAQSSCPQRKVPQPHAAFRNPKGRIVKTNLKVDDYLVDHLRNLMNLTNEYLWNMHHE